MMKKKLLLFILIILIPVFAWASGRIVFMVPGGSGGCPTGTYDFAYNGDHPSGAGYACWNSGASTEDGTVVDATVTSDYVDYSAANDYITWNDNEIDDDVGTIWFSFYVFTGGASASQLIECFVNAENKIGIRYSNGMLNAMFEAFDAHQYIYATSINAGTWYRAAYSWQTGADTGGKHALYVDDGSGWTEETEDLDSCSSSFDDITIGENLVGWPVDYQTRVKDVYYINSYQAADPL